MAQVDLATAPTLADERLLNGAKARPSRTSRALLAIGIAAACAVYVVAYGRANPDFVSDFDQVWVGARALWTGQDPYALVGPGRPFPWKWPLYYPVPALLIVAPLGLVPVLAARAVFASLSAALLAWACTRDGWQRLPIFLSVSFMVTVELGQWSALFAAAYFMPAVAALGVAKPNLGLAIGVSDERPRAVVWLVIGAVILVAVSLLVRPGWYESWLANLRESTHFRPAIVRPLGFLLLLAALRWRRRDARWLLALSVIPLPPTFYDQLLLAVVCRTTRESLVFAGSTIVLWFYVAFQAPLPDYASWGRVVGNATVWFCYLPVLAMVLRRPNDGQVPALLAVGRHKRGQTA